ncbi:MAG TPA: hypothetical protein VM121_06135 [Acidimicrobiales bacterium]|nr:hypothetical protein [Acidimicrobiales bacterium]
MSAGAPTPEYVTHYSLAGVRQASTSPHEALIARAVEVLSNDDRVLAGYLVGGFAVGLGDAFSDVDLQCCIRNEAANDLRSSWRDLVSQIAPLVHAQPFGGPMGGPIGGLCITPEWLHFDIVFNAQSAIDPRTVEGMVPLFDKADLLPDHPVARPDRRGEPFLPPAAVGHFLYMLGNVVSAIGRNEVIPAMNGVIMIRDIALVGLLLAEGGLATTREHVMGNPFPFTKRLRPYLTEEQNTLLESLPPLAPNLDSIIDGYVALAEAFLPRAKRLAAATGAPWPAEYEEASVAYFERMIGVALRL